MNIPQDRHYQHTASCHQWLCFSKRWHGVTSSGPSQVGCPAWASGANQVMDNQFQKNMIDPKMVLNLYCEGSVARISQHVSTYAFFHSLFWLIQGVVLSSESHGQQQGWQEAQGIQKHLGPGNPCYWVGQWPMYQGKVETEGTANPPWFQRRGGHPHMCLQQRAADPVVVSHVHFRVEATSWHSRSSSCHWERFDPQPTPAKARGFWKQHGMGLEDSIHARLCEDEVPKMWSLQSDLSYLKPPDIHQLSIIQPNL